MDHEIYKLPDPSNEHFLSAQVLHDRTTDSSSSRRTLPILLHTASGRTSHTDYHCLTGGSESTGAQKEAKQPKLGMWNTWWLERLCCILAIGAFIAIACTVYPFRNKPFPQWPHELSLNTLISIYTVIMKAAMAFVLAQGLGQLKWLWFQKTRPLRDITKYDNASRGGLIGPIDLLWTIRGRSFVASLGASLTILTLLLDPFSQQLIRYHSCSISSPSPQASIPLTSHYDGGGGTVHLTGSNMTALAYQMQAAIFNGLYNPGSTGVSWTCSSGNCTFPEKYHSVGYCSECRDVTGELVLKGESRETTYSLPSNFSALPGLRSFTMATEAGSNQNDYDVTSEMVYAGPIPEKCTNDWTCRGHGAARCNLMPCIRTYEASIQNGVFQEVLLAISSAWGADKSNLIMKSVDLTCTNASTKAELRKQGYAFAENDKWLAYNISYASGEHQAGPEVYAPVPSNCLYRMNYVFIKSLNNYMINFLAGNVSYDARELQGPQQLLVIFEANNISFAGINGAFHNISTAITNFMRQNGASNATNSAIGLLTKETTCVRVRWQWLYYPAALVVLTLSFFVVVVLETRRSTGHDFKASVLPLMFNGLHLPDHTTEGSTASRVSELEKEARDILVKFEKTGGNWRFRKIGTTSSNMERSSRVGS